MDESGSIARADPAWAAGWRRPAWWWFATGAALAVAGHVLLPRAGLPGEPVQATLYSAVAVGGAVAVGAGARRGRPGGQVAWWLLAAAMGASFLADGIVFLQRDAFGSTTFPSAADALYLGSYPLAVMGLARLTQGYSQGADRAALLDALILITSFTLIGWSYVIQPVLDVPGRSFAARLVLAAYPAANLVMLAVVMRLSAGPGRRPVSYWLLVIGLGALIVTDTAYTVIQRSADYGIVNPVDAGWMVWYACWGTAALHPSAREVGEPMAVPAPGLTTSRIVVLVGAALVTPSLLTAQALLGRRILLPVLVVCVVVLLVTVSARIKGLAEEVAEQAAARRALLGQAVRAAEEERVRVASELHDGPIQRLASLSYNVELARRRLARGEPPPGDATPSADSVLAGLARRLIGEVTALRHLMADLRPAVLDRHGLHAALRQCAQPFTERTGVRCTVEVTPVEGLDPAQETVLYRVAQEALTNVAKHADAKHVWLRLDAEPGAARLEVRDDGVGFDVDAAAKLVASHHYGLAGMRERVEMAGGTWLLRSRQGEGTVIVVTLPIGNHGVAG